MICNRPEQYNTIIDKEYILTPTKDNKIYWHLENFTPDMPKYKTILAFTQAFLEWQPYFENILFVPTDDPNKAQIKMKFANNDTVGLPIKFDEETLAYAYAPYKGYYHGTMWLNEDVQWSEMSKPKHFILKLVVVHELGHIFNIGHSKHPNEIMQPVYNEQNYITEDSILAIKDLYGDYLNNSIDFKTYVVKLLPNEKSLRKLYKKDLIVLAELLNVQLIKTNKNNIIKILINEIYN